jgi:hypothetical protein
MAGEEQELTPAEVAALVDDMTGVSRDDGFHWDDVAQAVARAEAASEEDES